MSSAAQQYLERWSNPARNAMYIIGGVLATIGLIMMLSSLNLDYASEAYAQAVWGGVFLGLGIQMVLMAVLLHGIAITAQSVVAELLEARA